MEQAAKYIVRKGKKGRYVVAEVPSHWLHRDVPGFATEAAAHAWIINRGQSRPQDL